MAKAGTSTTKAAVEDVCCGSPNGDTEAPDARVTNASPVLPAPAPPPAGSAACRSDDLSIQSAFGVPVHDGPGLFLRIFNHGRSCWLDGYVKVSLRGQGGGWRDFLYVSEKGTTTNGPEWTGQFDPKLTGVVVFGQAAPGDLPPTTYDALRLTLPNSGGVLEFAGPSITLTTDELSVYPIEADSQDG